jgi:HSP20 family protein
MNILPRRSGRKEPALTRAPSMEAFHSEFERLFARFFHDDPFGAPGSGGEMSALVSPALDVTESEREVTVRAELPGLKPEDIDLQMSGDVLTISGEKRQQAEESQENWYRAERRFGRFSRSVRLPAPVDADKVTAEYDQGVLVVHLPRSAASQARRIEVQPGQ